MKKALFVLFFAAVAFAGCSKTQEAAPEAQAPVMEEAAPAPEAAPQDATQQGATDQTAAPVAPEAAPAQ